MREKKKLSVQEFADGCGLSTATMYLLEAEDVRTFLALSTEDLGKIAKFSDVALSVKLTDMDEEVKVAPPSYQEEIDKCFKLICDFSYGDQYVCLLKKISAPVFMVNVYTNTQEPKLIITTSIPEGEFDEAVTIYQAHVGKIIINTENSDLLVYAENAPTIAER
jgi:transcriptional regulator with XRE-family HTH domain